MLAIRSIWIIASLALSTALLSSAQQTLSSGVQAEYDSICQDQAAQNGIEDPGNWVWSDDEEYCVPNALDSNSPDDVQAIESGVESGVENGIGAVEQGVGDVASGVGSVAGSLGLRSAKFARALEAPQACDEGMSTCLQNCGDFNPGSYQDGQSGAWAGCRASCSFRCSPARGGCWKGYCWAGCSTGFPLTEGAEWCYTTQSYSQSYQYVRCSDASQCNKNWKCGGPCAAF
ncbi:Allergen Tha p 2 [Psilocybe cubensis]|uniref:Allergen Tha p 2 n=2 Tax=Psilocybe cubensis TaxID=181762 RepID=A0ACB8GSP7_PSICU|nr:Allergen Tha p 2 [Psilocybe cubensis]KAH9478500.1 Allergen Tha p 2 [Psilocybe cubensis]